MDLSRYRALVTVVQSGSFTRAAERLRTQKARVSRQISELEAELGVRLLERTTRRLRLTEVGREIYERSVDILEAVEDTRRLAQAVRGEPRGLLRVTMPLEFGLLAGFAWVGSMLAHHPELTIEVDSASRLLDLVHEGFDLAIRVGSLRDSRMAARRLGELHYGLYAAPDYLRRRGIPQSPVDLAHHDLICFSPGGRSVPLRLQRTGESPTVLEVAPRLRVDSRYAQRDALIAGLGVGENLRMIAAPEVAAGRLVPVLSEWVGLPVPVHAVFPSQRYLTPKVRAFVDHALLHFPANQGLL